LHVWSVRARRGLAPATAGLGYLLAGGASSALLLYGLALVFGLTGQTRLSATGVAMAALGPNHPAVLLSLSLILGGLALRMGLLPVRWWPRGFEAGVPLRVVMFVQSVGVVVAFAAFARLAASTFAGSRIPYAAIFAAVGLVDRDAVRDLAGMSRAAPGLALALGVAVVSLIGLPPVAGFFGKVLVLQAAVNSGYAWLAVVGAANIAVAAFGYLRL